MFGGGLAQCASTTPLLIQIFVHAGRLTSVRTIAKLTAASLRKQVVGQRPTTTPTVLR